MSEQNRPEINPEDYGKKVGSEMPEREPLELLPEREWLNARINDVKYQVAMFNNQVQYMTYKNDSGEDVDVLDGEGQKIMRREFEFIFIFEDYKLPNGESRKAWLRLGASMGEKAHLPQFLNKVLNISDSVETPQDIIAALKGKEVQLQLKNKESKDQTKTYQNVVWDAVRTPPINTAAAVAATPQPEPKPQLGNNDATDPGQNQISEPQDAGPETPQEDAPPPAQDPQYCSCGVDCVSKRVEKNGMIIDECTVCSKPVVAWDS